MESTSQVRLCPFWDVCVAGRFRPVLEALPTLQLVTHHYVFQR